MLQCILGLIVIECVVTSVFSQRATINLDTSDYPNILIEKCDLESLRVGKLHVGAILIADGRALKSLGAPIGE